MLIEIIRQLAAESPDNVYNSGYNGCSYTQGVCTNGSVGCIVGQALVKMGHYDDLEEFDMDVMGDFNELNNEYNLVNVSDEELQWIQEVQKYQDGSRLLRREAPKVRTWGDAIEYADSVVRL